MASKNVPVDKKLWGQIQSLAKGERKSPVTKGGETVNPVNDGEGFKVFPSAYANGWALAQYKRLGGKWKKEASSKGRLVFLGKESGYLPYSFYFLRLSHDYFYHYTYRERAEEILDDGYLRPNFYNDQPGGAGVFAISGTFGQEVTHLQVSGTRKDHMDRIVAVKFKTSTLPKYGFIEEVIWDKNVKLRDAEIVSVSEVLEDIRRNPSIGDQAKVYYDIKKAVEQKNKLRTKKASYEKPRKWDKKHCESKTCDEMGFSEKASCRPYKNCYKKSASDLIPPPPSVRDLLTQLPEVARQYEDRYNEEAFQPYLDKCLWKVFDLVLIKNGHESRSMEIKDIGDKIAPIISSLKSHFNLLRPNQLAELKGIPFKYDYLETAQTPSYPSGHTTQAYYIAHKLSDQIPHLRADFFSVAKRVAESRLDRGVHFPSDNDAAILLAEKLHSQDNESNSRVAQVYLESTKRDDPKKKNTGHGGLDTWFSGHGGGKPDERATWGDWVAITPVKRTIKKEDGKKKTYEPGDIVGPCGISSEPEWASLTGKGKKPLKCMPREKAHKMPKEDRASLAKNKKKEENKSKGKKPVNTPTFSEEAKEIKKSASRVASRFLKSDFYRQVSPPDELSSLSQGTPVHRTNDPKSQSSSLPDGDSARNIGRPSPDSPSVKYKDLHRQPKPSDKADLGYVHDSGSGSARVIPYDSGFANNSSSKRASMTEDEILAIDLSFFGKYDFYPLSRSHAKPSTNGMKLSIQGKTFEDIITAYGLVRDYLRRNKIYHKVATRKRVEKASPPQSYKIITVYLPDGEDWREIAEEVSLLLAKGRYTGWHGIKTPPLYEHYSNAVFFRNDRDEAGEYILADRYAASQPAQDLAGVKTWVTKNRQDQSYKSTEPLKMRPDYGDGSPDRDRVLPLPDGHPKGRDEIRQGPGVMNTPPDSSGQGSANRPKKNPNSISEKPLHQRPRSSGVPGDQYGHPYIDQSTSTGIKRRGVHMKQLKMEVEEIWDVGEDGDLVKVAIKSVLPPRKRQRTQRGLVKREYKVRYRRKTTKEKKKDSIMAKRRYKRNPRRHIKYQERRRRYPHLFKRQQAGGVSTRKQVQKRDNKTRKQKK